MKILSGFYQFLLSTAGVSVLYASSLFAAGEGLYVDYYGATIEPSDWVTCATVEGCRASFCGRFDPSASCVFTGTGNFGGWSDSNSIEVRTCTGSCSAVVNGVFKHFNLKEVRCNEGFINPVWTHVSGGLYRLHCTQGTCPTGTQRNDRGECIVAYDEEKSYGSCPPGLCTEGNPVHPATGNKFQVETDYTSTAQSGLSFRRYHNSRSERITEYGHGWTADFRQSIVDLSGTAVEVRRPDGKVLVFTNTGSGWAPDPDVTLELTEILDQGIRTGWELITSDNKTEVYEYDGGSLGRLISITDRNGFTTSLVYDLAVAGGGDGDPATLDQVTDHFGRTLDFTYNSNGRVGTMIDPAGNTYTYSYANQNLITVEAPVDGGSSTTRTYHYEDANYPHSLTGITDETGNRYATYTYDNYNRVVNSQLTGGAQAISLDYAVDSTTISDALGNVRTLHFEVLHDRHRLEEITGDPCDTCGNRFADTTYDANGFIASRTDFNGNTTTYVHNARGLETSRTEAVGTPQERTITTEWHPDFRLPVKITEPGKVTTFTYDSQGRLLERKEEAVQ